MDKSDIILWVANGGDPEVGKLALEALDRREADSDAIILLREWRETPFFELPSEWKTWADDFGPRVDEIIRSRAEKEGS